MVNIVNINCIARRIDFDGNGSPEIVPIDTETRRPDFVAGKEWGGGGVRLEVSKSGQLSARVATANNSFPAFKSDTYIPPVCTRSLSRYHAHQGDRIIDIIILVIFLLTEGSAINGNIQTSLSKYYKLFLRAESNYPSQTRLLLLLSPEDSIHRRFCFAIGYAFNVHSCRFLHCDGINNK